MGSNLNSDEWGKKNCQTESKISAADKKGGRKLNPIMKKNYILRMLWNTSKEIVSLFLFLNENAIGRSVKKKKPKDSVMHMLLKYGFLSLYSLEEVLHLNSL